MGAFLFTATCGVGDGTVGVGEMKSSVSVGEGVVVTGMLVSAGSRVLVGVGRSGVEVNDEEVSEVGRSWLVLARREIERFAVHLEESNTSILHPVRRQWRKTQ